MIDKLSSKIINICLLSISITCLWLVIDIIYNNRSQNFILKISILFAIFIYYLSVGIHELAHFFAFKFYKVQIRAICITPFCFIYNGQKWDTKINWNNIGLGGAIVTNQVVVKNDNDFMRIKKAFAYSMLVATIMSIIILIAGTFFIVMGYFFYNNERLITLGGFLIFINSIIVMGCFTKTNNVSGDFFAYTDILKDDDMVTRLIYNNVKLSVDYKKIRKNNNYLRGRLIDCFEKKVKKDITGLDVIEIVTNLINEYLIDNKDLPNSVLKYINEFSEKSVQFNKLKNTESFKKYIVMIAYYLEYSNKHEEALKIYKMYIMNFTNSNVDKYRKIQSEQIICYKDNTDFLLKYKNIKPDSFYSFYRIFDGYITDEIVINERVNL